MADQTFAVHCGFFDAIDSDRVYSADEMNRPYRRVISNGVFATPQGNPSTDLQVVESSGMNIICKSGEGLFADKWFENPSSIVITVPNNTSTVPRIDSVLVQVDTRTSGRVGNIVYRTGTPSSSPTPPDINQTEGVVEYRLANIRVNAGVTSIAGRYITDRRGSSDCPWVTSLIYQVDTSTLYDQWQAAYEEYFEAEKAIWDAWYAQLTEDLDVSMTLDRHINTVTTTGTTFDVGIGLDYNHNTDILEVYINGLRAVEGAQYTASDDASISLVNPVSGGQTITFVVLRSVISGSATSIMTILQSLEDKIAGIAGGTPTVVDAKADMTEHDKIYILSSDSKWYYYSTTASDWLAGGTYGGVPTDTTLSISGSAADAKAVGDALALKADDSDVDALDERVTDAEGDIGDLTQLDTTVKTDLVSAINEVAQNTSSDYILLNDANNQLWKITISTTGVLTTERYVEPSTIQRTLSNVNYYEDFEGFENGQEYIETFIAVDGYTIEGATVSVTMGGVDITSSVYSDLGAVIIPEVTGDVVISIQAVQINYVTPPASDFTLQLYSGKQAIKAYVGTDTAIEVPTTLTVNGQEYQTSMWSCTFPSTVEHIKLNAIPAAYGNADALPPSIPNTVKTLWLVGDDGRSYNTPTSAERIVRPSSCKALGNARTRVTSLRDAVYQSSLTSLSSGCSGATSLVDGGTIPSTISNIYYLFNGATKLRRARIEGKTFSNFSGCFTGVPKRAKVQLYIDSDIYTSYRNNASNGQSTNDNSIPVMFESIDPTTPIRYLFCIGDSLTLGTGSTTIATDSYPALLKGMFSADVFVRNVGAGSTTSANHLNTMNSAPLNYYYGNKNNGFIIWSGTNGVNSTVRSDIQSMVNLLGGNEHYLVIPAAVTGGGYTYEQQLAWALETFGVDHVFDVYGYFTDNGYDRTEYMSDSLHYNTAGYAIIANGIYAKISGWF